MKASLRWALGATLFVSALAQWWPATTVSSIAAVERRADDRSNIAASTGQAEPLPRELMSLDVEAAKRDFFVAEVPPQPPAPAVQAPPSVMAPIVQPAPPTPSAPPVNVRYVGTMVTPEGKRMVLLAQGDMAMTAEIGAPIGEGYVVESVSRAAVRLVYPPLGTRVDVPLPDFESAN